MKRILAYRFSAFGDVAMAIPVCIEFLEQNPDVEIYFASRENFRQLFENQHPRLYYFGIDFNRFKGFLGIRRLGKKMLKDVKPDYIADLHDVIRTKVINSVFKSHNYDIYQIDKGKEDKERLTNIWNLDKFQLKRTVERYADVFRSIGFSL